MQERHPYRTSQTIKMPITAAASPMARSRAAGKASATDIMRFMPSGKSVGPSDSLEDEGGALAAHGDHVIADAICHLARRDQPRALASQNLNPRPNTIGWRIQEHQLEMANSNENSRWYD